MPPIRTENKTVVLRYNSKKRQRPGVEEGLVQENQNETAKRVRTNGIEGRLNEETVRERQKEAEVSTSQAATRRSTRKTKSTKTDQVHHARTDGKQTILVPPQGFAGKPDHVSVAKVAEMVKMLNAEIEQLSSLMTDSLSYRRLPGSGSKCGMALNELHDYLGAQLCDELQRRSNQINMEPNLVITQITLQTGLVNICSRIIVMSDWDHPSWGENSTSSRMVSNMEQVVTDTWRKQTHTNTTASLHENQEFNEKYLTDVLLKLITAVGGSPQTEVTLPSHYNAKLQGIVQQAIELQKIVVTSTGFVTYAIPCGAEFDPSEMEDVKCDIAAPLGRVACTVEMGVRCRKRIDSGSKVSVVVKPKVVLATTLEALCSMSLTKNVKQLEVKVTEMYQRLQKNAEKLSIMGVEANWWNEDHAKDIGRLEARIVAQDQVLQKNGIKGTANERVHVLSEAQGTERRQAATGLHDNSVEGEYTHKPSASVRKPDSISVTEVVELVRILNAQIEQVSILVADSLSYNETPSSGEVRIVLDELDDHVGQWLYNNLWSRLERKIEPDNLITQITIQTGLVHLCCGIVNGFLIGGNSNAAGASQGSTDVLRARAHSHMAFSQSECKEAVRKYLMELLLKLITAVGGSQETLQTQYSEKVEDITMKAIELHRIISQDVTSVELSTYTIPCDTRFDPSQMEDTEGEENTTVPVVCTLEMGLLCKKKIAYANQSGGEHVSMKAKVVLTTTLETGIPE